MEFLLRIISQKLFFLLLINLLVFAKLLGQTCTISGYVSDAETGERIISAAVYRAGSATGTYTNAYGFYSLIVDISDTASISVSAIAYQTKKISLKSTVNQTINIQLIPNNTIEEVTVTAKRIKDNTGSIEIPMKDIKAAPSLFGETNLLKTVQMLPGVKFGNEGNSAVYVRGGSPDQNLIMLDGAPLYRVSHYGGLFSIFNTDAVKSVKLIKGGYPARYSGRLSSVLDVRMKEGNLNEMKLAASAGIMSAKFMIEAPIVERKSSFMLSARRSVLDLLTYTYGMLKSDAGFGTSFYDINAKCNTLIGTNDRLYISFYHGNDNLFLKTKALPTGKKSESDALWGNTLLSIRYNKVFASKLFADFTTYYTRYRLSSNRQSQVSDTQKAVSGFDSHIRDFAGRADFEYKPLRVLQTTFGGSYILHKFNPGMFSYFTNIDSSSQIDTTFGNNNIFSQEANLYLENQLKFRFFLANAGINYSHYQQNKSSFHAFEPRLTARVELPLNINLSTSYSHMQQYLHFLTSSGVGMPTDLWVPATEFVKPEKAQQVSISLYRYFAKYKSELSIEAYHKTMSGLIAYKEGTTFYSGAEWQDKVERKGNGLSYGLEFFAQKKEGVFTGWAGYTWSRSYRQFSNINAGKPYFHRYDRTHDINLSASCQINDRLSVSASWVYATGNAITLPIGKHRVIDYHPSGQGNFVTNTYAHIYSERNSYRMEAYHRLDIGLIYTTIKKNSIRTWNFSLYNAYNRKNPSYYDFSVSDSGKGINLHKHTAFPLIPSVSYSFKFKSSGKD